MNLNSKQVKSIFCNIVHKKFGGEKFVRILPPVSVHQTFMYFLINIHSYNIDLVGNVRKLELEENVTFMYSINENSLQQWQDYPMYR